VIAMAAVLLGCAEEVDAFATPTDEVPSVGETGATGDTGGLQPDTGRPASTLTGAWEGDCEQGGTFTTRFAVTLELVQRGDGSIDGSGTLDIGYYFTTTTYGLSYEVTVAGTRTGDDVDLTLTTYVQDYGFVGRLESTGVLTGDLAGAACTFEPS